MRKVTSLALTLTLAMMASTVAQPPSSIPRKSSELTINETSGKQIPLSSFQGKVVVIEFLFLRSPHCQRVAQTLNRLYSDLGPMGFQPVGIVFGPGADVQKAPETKANTHSATNLVFPFCSTIHRTKTRSDFQNSVLKRGG